MSRDALRVILTRVMKLENVHIFEDSENFLARVRDLPQRPNIFLLDIHVPPHDGFEMLEMLRQDSEFADSTIVALTASVMNEEVDQLRSAGFDGVVGKPLSVSTFPNVLERIVNGDAIWHVTDA